MDIDDIFSRIVGVALALAICASACFITNAKTTYNANSYWVRQAIAHKAARWEVDEKTGQSVMVWNNAGDEVVEPGY